MTGLWMLAHPWVLIGGYAVLIMAETAAFMAYAGRRGYARGYADGQDDAQREKP
jgi:hypothetical protein